MIPIRNRQIVRRRIVAHSKHRSRDRMTLYERKIRCLVAEAGWPVIAREDRFRAQKQEIEIAVVVVVDPNGLFVGASYQLRRALLKNSLVVVVEQDAAIREDA